MASNKRERELARMRAERQAARRAAEEQRRKQRRNSVLAGVAALSVVAVVVAIALVAGLGGTDKKDTTVSGTFGNVGGTGSCSYTKTGDAAGKVDGTPPTSKVRNTGTQKVTFETTQGTVTADLLTSKAPCTINSLAFLSQQGYFDNTPCHRLTTSGIYVLQCGDPTGKGNGGPGYQFPDENLQGATYPKGTLAMANAGAGTNGSQFFLVYKDSPLPPNYTMFGTISGGKDELLAIAKAGAVDEKGKTAGDGKPRKPVTITTATLLK